MDTVEVYCDGQRGNPLHPAVRKAIDVDEAGWGYAWFTPDHGDVIHQRAG